MGAGRKSGHKHTEAKRRSRDWLLAQADAIGYAGEDMAMPIQNTPASKLPAGSL